MLKKRDRIIDIVRKGKTKCLKKSYQLSIELPKSVEQALSLDAKNDNTLWADEVSNERVSKWHLRPYQMGRKHL